MEFVWADIQCGHLGVRDFDTGWVSAIVDLGFDVSPARVVVATISCPMVWQLTRGLPRQFWVMNENSLCSILFHLLVPGGR